MTEQHTDQAEQKQNRYRGLRPFRPGQSGNPKGRPKGTLSLLEILKRELQKMPRTERRSRGEALVTKIIDQAMTGDEASQKLIMNYVEGMPKTPVDLGIDREGLAELTELFRQFARTTHENDDGSGQAGV